MQLKPKFCSVIKMKNSIKEITNYKIKIKCTHFMDSKKKFSSNTKRNNISNKQLCDVAVVFHSLY